MKAATVKPAAMLTPHAGKLEWRTLVQWLHEDGLISAAEAIAFEAKKKQKKDKP